jgi:predicted NBD/HSP70 family sugar kinase
MKHVGKKKEHDKLTIEAVVRRFGPVSRVQIHELTKFRKTTISDLVRELLEEGRVVEAGLSNNPMGRKQVLLTLNSEYGSAVALEFDENTVVAGVLDIQLRIRKIIKEPTNLAGGVEGLLKQLQTCVWRVIREAKIRNQSLLGIGIADPGLVDSRRGVTATSSTIEFWKEVPLKETFERRFKSPTVVESKTRAKTVAERMLGAGDKCENMIYVDYGVGIGAGIIVDGRLLYGQDCAVGEFGHTHAVEGGPACKCGSIGCLEAVVGANAIVARIRKALHEGTNSQVLSLAGLDEKNLTAWMVLQAASAGDKICGNIVAELGNYLGLGLASLANLFNPAIVVLDKRLETAGDGLLDQIMQVIKRQALSNSVERLSLRFAKVASEPGLLGMGLLVLDKHFEIPALRPPRFMVEPVPLMSGLRPLPLNEVA